MDFAKWLCVLLLCAVSSTELTSAQLGFKCTTPGSTCRSLIGYPSPNKTTISAIRKFFGVKKLRNLLGANNLPPSTPPDYPVEANQVIKVPVPCICYNGSGVSNRVPTYTVQKDDGLYYIANSVFMGLVKYQQIKEANMIPDANIIDVGQQLWIPLPCSCDAVEEQRVVHYGHMVVGGSTVEQIAQQFGTTAEIVYGLNDIADNSQLIEGNVIDVPLRACNSSVRSDSLDSPLLVANGTYVFTANNCVKCSCSANNWTLQCESSGLGASNWSTCPAMQCTGSSYNLTLGNTTTNGCSTTTCAYAGYLANQTILRTLAEQSTCPGSTTPGPSSGASSIGLSSSFFLLICIHLILLSLS